jgi:hypothetical protein
VEVGNWQSELSVAWAQEEGYPPPCFCERVRNPLKIKELSFWRIQKSAQEYEKKRDSQRTSAVGMFGRFEDATPSTLFGTI